MNILTINTGSSSIRLAAFSLDSETLEPLSNGRYELTNDYQGDLLNDFLKCNNIHTLSAVVHRVVHGGEELVHPCLIDDKVEGLIETLSPLAPLHNPVALAWIRIAQKITRDNVSQIAVFDTAFFRSLPAVARTYALPKSLLKQYGIRRFGFHGLAHQALWRAWTKIRSDLSIGGRVITLQLGAGSSITAINQGNVKDTSMGFSPLEGLMMATRCGDIDPGITTYLLKNGKLKSAQLDEILSKSSGLLGVSGISADMRILLNSDEPSARLAIELYCYRIRKYIGAYLAILGGIDGIVFGGGIGENVPRIREMILNDLEVFGIYLDRDRNISPQKKEGRISSDRSSVDARVVPVDEARMMAEEAVTLLQKSEQAVYK